MWYQKEFKELELKEFYEIVQLRLETFVVEQTRIYNDLDDVDYRSIHLFHQNREGRVDAYARIFATGLTIHFWPSGCCQRQSWSRTGKGYGRANFGPV